MAVTVVTAFSDRSDGSFAVDEEPAGLAARRRALAPHPWSWLDQVHGARVVVVERPGDHAGEAGDALVTTTPGAVLAVQSADCAPVLVWDEAAGVVAAVHAGWRGLVAEVLQQAVEAMGRLGADQPRAAVGPCICAACYEFGAADLARLERRYPGVSAHTAAGAPALALVAGVAAALAEVDVPLDRSAAACTAEDPLRWFSHRAREERGRLASAIWLEAREPGS